MKADAIASNTKARGFADRPDAQAQDIATIDMQRAMRIDGERDQPPGERQNRRVAGRCDAGGFADGRADQLGADRQPIGG